MWNDSLGSEIHSTLIYNNKQPAESIHAIGEVIVSRLISLNLSRPLDTGYCKFGTSQQMYWNDPVSPRKEITIDRRIASRVLGFREKLLKLLSGTLLSVSKMLVTASKGALSGVGRRSEIAIGL